MTRKVSIALTRLSRHGRWDALVTVATIRRRCIDCSAATVSVNVNGSEVTHQCIGITDTSALTSMAQWLLEKFGAKAASINREWLATSDRAA